jgi:hypothetical protein
MAQDRELVRTCRIRMPSQARTGLFLVILILAVVSSILCTGYRDVKGANHPFQLIIIQKIHDPSLYATDVFVESTVFAYASLLWYGVAYLSGYLDLSMLLFSLFLINRVLYATGFYLVGRVFFPNSLIAPVGALTFFALSPTSIIGSGHPIRDYAEQTGLAVALGVLLLIAFTQRRYLLVTFLLGAVINLNLMYGVFVVSHLFASLIFIDTHRRDWRRILASVVVGGIIGLPAFALALFSASRPVNNETAVWQTAELVFPSHFFPNAESVKDHTVFFSIVLILIFVCRHKCRAEVNPLPWKNLLVWSGLALVFYLLYWAVPYLLRSLVLLQVHPIRGHDLWFLIGGAVLCGSFLTFLQRALKEKSQKFVILCLVTFSLINGIVSQVERIRKTGNWLGIPYSVSDKIAIWAKENTPRESVFLIPVALVDEWSHFRHLSQRSIFTHWKDGSAWPYAPWFAEEWLNRLYLLGLAEVAGIDPKTYHVGKWVHLGKDFIRLYRKVDERLTQAQVERIAQKYRVDYWVLPEGKQTTYPVIYRVEGWKVVRVIPTDGRAEQQLRR